MTDRRETQTGGGEKSNWRGLVQQGTERLNKKMAKLGRKEAEERISMRKRLHLARTDPQTQEDRLVKKIFEE